MSNSIIQSNTVASKLSLKLASLQPKKRTSNQAKFDQHYDDIVDAIKRGVSQKDIRAALAEDGIPLSSPTFKKLLEAKRKRREVDSDEADRIKGGEA